MFYAAYRWKMLPLKYLEEQTEAGHLALLAWCAMHEWDGPRYVDETETTAFDWEKECPHWGDKVASAKFQLSAKVDGQTRTADEIERAIKARFAMAKVTIGVEEPSN